MAAGNFAFFNAFGLALGKKQIDLLTGSLYLALMGSSYTPDAAAQAVYGDLSGELATAGGYTAGGVLVSPAWTRSGNVATFNLASPALWSITATIQAKAAVLYADAGSGVKPLIGYFLLDSAGVLLTFNAGAALSITPGASGLFTITT